jgi:hypothetical protein
MSQISSTSVIVPPAPGTGIEYLTGDNTAVLIAPNSLNSVNVVGGTNINTHGIYDVPTDTSVVQVNLDNAVYLPATTSNGLSGVYGIDGVSVLHTFGGAVGHNVGVGSNALNLAASNTGTNNTAAGYNSLRVNTTGSINTAIGANSMVANTTGNNCTAIGLNSLAANTTGSSNISIGYASSSLMSNNASNNIVIGNTGAPGISNAVIIGTTGTHTANTQAGIYQVAPTATSENVVIDNTGKLGTSGPEAGKYGFSYYTLGSHPVKYQSVGPTPNIINYMGIDIPMVQDYDPGNLFNMGTGQYVVPVNGLYSFTFNLAFNNIKNTNALQCHQRIHFNSALWIYCDSVWSPLYSRGGSISINKNAENSLTVNKYLLAGQVVNFYFNLFAEQPYSKDLLVFGYSNISGYLIHT